MSAQTVIPIWLMSYRQGKYRKFTEYVEIMGTYNPADIALIKSILDAENITYYFNAEHFRNVEPLAETVRLMVKKDEAKRRRRY